MAITQRASATVALATRTNTTVTPPASMSVGELLVVDICVGGAGGAPTITPPAGWTTIKEQTYGDASDNYYLRMGRYVKAWASGETSYVFTHVNKSSQAYTRALVGADTASPNDGTAFSVPQDNENLATIAGSMTTLTDGAWVLPFRGSWDGNAISPPAGFTEQYDTPVIWGGYQEKATAGTTGTITVSAGNSGNAPSGLIISAIKPAGASTPKGGFAGGYGFGAAAAGGDRLSEGGFAGGFGFGPATAAGDRPAEGSFATGGYAFGPAVADGLMPSEGGFTGAYAFGPADAAGPPIGSAGGFEGTYGFGPAVFDGLAQQGGGFNGAVAFGPAVASSDVPHEAGFAAAWSMGPGVLSGESPSKGAFTGAVTFGPSAATGDRVAEGGFAGGFSFGPAVARGPAFGSPWPASVSMMVDAPDATLSVDVPILTLEVLSA